MSRPKGLPKTGGRKKGTSNRATAAREAAIRESGLSPLDFMLSIMRNEANDIALRFDAAKVAAPYVHPRLASIDPDNRNPKPREISSEDDGHGTIDFRRATLEAIDAAFAEVAEPAEARPLPLPSPEPVPSARVVYAVGDMAGAVPPRPRIGLRRSLAKGY